MKPKTHLGQTAEIILPEITHVPLIARVDTGAKTSSIWVSKVTEVDAGLEVVFFGEGVPHYNQKTVVFADYGDTMEAVNRALRCSCRVQWPAGLSGRGLRWLIVHL